MPDTARQGRDNEHQALADWLAWLESKGSKPCTCRWAWRNYRDEMPGWVRVITEPGCLEHGTASR